MHFGGWVQVEYKRMSNTGGTTVHMKIIVKIEIMRVAVTKKSKV